MAYWWVSLGSTYKQEVTGFMWSPQKNKNGSRSPYYDNMTKINPGDIIFAFADTYIKAIGIAVSRAQQSPKPDFGRAGVQWANEGWLVEVEFTELIEPIQIRKHMNIVGPVLPAKYSPLQANGDGQQAYLFSVPEELASVLAMILGSEFSEIVSNPVNFPVDEEDAENASVSKLEMRFDISTTEKLQLMKSRRGQGLFKANVRLVESKCRVTGVSQISMLRASHIKPWKDATDIEKIDGFNGLLLAPHVDHLFDKGFITFEGKGDMVLSPVLNREVLDRWKIPRITNVGSFTEQQTLYLSYHQEYVFKAS